MIVALGCFYIPFQKTAKPIFLWGWKNSSSQARLTERGKDYAVASNQRHCMEEEEMRRAWLDVWRRWLSHAVSSLCPYAGVNRQQTGDAEFRCQRSRTVPLWLGEVSQGSGKVGGTTGRQGDPACIRYQLQIPAGQCAFPRPGSTTTLTLCEMLHTRCSPLRKNIDVHLVPQKGFPCVFTCIKMWVIQQCSIKTILKLGYQIYSAETGQWSWEGREYQGKAMVGETLH